MRVYFLSNYVGYPDEAMKIIALRLEQELSRRHNVLHSNARRSLTSLGFWRRLRSFKPDIVHIFLGPFVSTFLIAKLLKIYCSGARVVISQLQPPTSGLLRRGVISVLKPDLAIAQSKSTAELYSSRGCRTVLLRGGVDTEKFKPVSAEVKRELRKKYSIHADKFVTTHAGPIKKGRNIQILTDLQKRMGNQVVVVGSSAFKPEPQVYSDLKTNGCVVLTEFLPNVEEIYGLSDCYLFPTTQAMQANELPLSVLEAMSCNLPVVSTRFGALVDMFSDGDGLFFASDDRGLLEKVEEIKANKISANIRSKVMPYSWQNLATELEAEYKNLVANS